MSEIYDYKPSVGGRPVDVAATGGAVSKLEIFATSARTGVPIVQVDGSSPNGDGSRRFTFDAPGTPNRYYAQVTWTASGSAPASVDKTIVLDLPIRYDLVISCEQAAIKLGVPLPPTDTQRARLEQEIEQVQTDAANYINRLIFPFYETLTGYLPRLGYPLLDYRSWPQLIDRYNDRVTVLAARDTGTGGFDLDVMVGIDGRNEPALTRFVLASVVEGIRHDPSAGMGKREITSVSAEGQSVTYKDGSTDADAAGALPKLDSLRSLKRASVYRSTRVPDPPFPYRSTVRRFY